MICDFLSCNYKLEVFCDKCKKIRIYDGINNGNNDFEKVKQAYHMKMMPEMGFSGFTSVEHTKQSEYGSLIRKFKIQNMTFKYSGDPNHFILYTVFLDNDYIMKVGQYPSFADADTPQIIKYRSILGNDYYSELKRAIGLYSCGIGIGSFVYLRRIIERLVYDEYEEAKKHGMTDQEFEYQSDGEHRNGMVEKIKLLKGFLHDIMTSNAIVYGIVSKGIHELTEEECMKYFSVIEGGIKMILDDMVAKKNRKR